MWVQYEYPAPGHPPGGGSAAPPPPPPPDTGTQSAAWYPLRTAAGCPPLPATACTKNTSFLHLTNAENNH